MNIENIKLEFDMVIPWSWLENCVHAFCSAGHFSQWSIFGIVLYRYVFKKKWRISTRYGLECILAAWELSANWSITKIGRFSMGLCAAGLCPRHDAQYPSLFFGSLCLIQTMIMYQRDIYRGSCMIAWVVIRLWRPNFFDWNYFQEFAVHHAAYSCVVIHGYASSAWITYKKWFPRLMTPCWDVNFGRVEDPTCCRGWYMYDTVIYNNIIKSNCWHEWDTYYVCTHFLLPLFNAYMYANSHTIIEIQSTESAVIVYCIVFPHHFYIIRRK